MDILKLYKICTRCSGTGIAKQPSGENGEVEVECPDCGGTGRVENGWAIEYEEEDKEEQEKKLKETEALAKKKT